MAKKRPLETDMARLQKKVRDLKGTENDAEGNEKLRSLHKRLKRAQRKRRKLATRKQHAMGKKAEAQKAATASA